MGSSVERCRAAKHYLYKLVHGSMAILGLRHITFYKDLIDDDFGYLMTDNLILSSHQLL